MEMTHCSTKKFVSFANFQPSPLFSLIGVNAAEGRIRSYMDALDGEQLVNEYRTVRKAATLPNWIRAMLVQTLEKRPAFLLGRTSKFAQSWMQWWNAPVGLVWSLSPQNCFLLLYVFSFYRIARYRGVSGNVEYSGIPQQMGRCVCIRRG